jgi:phospholipase/carboxylesterase
LTDPTRPTDSDLPDDPTQPDDPARAGGSPDAGSAGDPGITGSGGSGGGSFGSGGTDAPLGFPGGSEPGMDDLLMLPTLTGEAPKRLLVMLHGAGSSAGAIVSAAIAWQLKFRSALALLLQAPHTGPDGQRYWVDPAEYPVSAAAIAAAADAARNRIGEQQTALGLPAKDTLVVGFSQGASVALEMTFAAEPCAAITIGYAARLYRVPGDDDRARGQIHLLHGGADSVVPAVYGEMAYRRLRAAGAQVSLDLLPEEGHSVGQMLINRGTQHAMNWMFDRGEAPPAGSPH